MSEERPVTLEFIAAQNQRVLSELTDRDIARQIADNPDAAPNMAPEIDARAIRRAAGMTQAQFAAAYEFSDPNIASSRSQSVVASASRAALLRVFAIAPIYASGVCSPAFP